MYLYMALLYTLTVFLVSTAVSYYCKYRKWLAINCYACLLVFLMFLYSYITSYMMPSSYMKALDV